MVIKLQRSAWHKRLQTQMLGKHTFDNFCPYFWLTLFCVAISPIYWPLRGFGMLVKKLPRLPRLSRVEFAPAPASNRKQILNQIVKWTRYGAFAGLSVLFLFGLYEGGRFLLWLFNLIHWKEIFYFIIHLPMMIWRFLTGLNWKKIVSIICKLVVFIFAATTFVVAFKLAWPITSKVLGFIFSPIVVFLEFIWDGIIILKKNYCPQIEWVE